MAAADNIRTAIEDLVLPELCDLNSRMASMEGKILGVEAKTDAVRAEIEAALTHHQD